MNKVVPIVIGVVLLAGIGGFVVSKSNKNDSKSGSSNSSTASKEFKPPVACDLFTLDNAKSVLGATAEKPDTAALPTASSDDIEVTQCIYQTPANDLASIKTQKQASVLVRGAKTETGAKSNEDVFKGSLKPAGVQDVSDYGEAAFWNPQFAQLNVLKNGNWYILQVGSSTPTERTIDDAKKLASELNSKF
jgi:hypothetical protein